MEYVYTAIYQAVTGFDHVQHTLLHTASTLPSGGTTRLSGDIQM